jgi:hypothetical protein
VSDGVDERPGKLDQDGCQLAFRPERFDPKLEIINILLSESFPFVCENLVELDRKKKIWVIRDSFDPGQRHLDRRGSVECAVDFDDIDVLGQKEKRMKSLRLSLWIDDALPVFIAPASSTDIITRHRILF